MTTNPSMRFDKSKSGVIYEHLALAQIEIEDEETLSFNNGSIEESVKILKIAVSEPGNSGNWRLYDLIARLISLQNEEDPDKARLEIIEVLNNSKVSGDWKSRDPLSRANDKDKFNTWHSKTVDKAYGDYRKNLTNRVNSSKKLTKGS